MTEAIILDSDRKSAWDEFVLRHPDAISWHVYDWCNVLCSYYGLAYFPLAVIAGSEVRGILPLYRVRTFRSGTALISIPYFVAGGIVADDQGVEALLLQEAMRLSREMGMAPIALKQYRHRVAGDLVTDCGYYNLELCLADGLHHVWDNLREENRKAIDSTEGEPWELDYPSSDLAGFHRTLARHQHDAGVPAPSLRWVRLLVESGIYSVALLKHGGRIAAGTLVKTFKQTVSFPYTCLASPDRAARRFAYRLYWELLGRLTSDGIGVFNSGRIPKNDAAPSWRLGWGGGRQEYYYQYVGLRGRTETGSKRGRGRTVAEAVWRRMPVTVANLLSPSIMKQYP